MKLSYPAFVAISLIGLSACNSGSDSAAPTGNSSVATSTSSSTLPTGSTTPAPTASSRTWSTDVLLFTGSGTWGTEVTNLENILKAHGATFTEVSSTQLDSMSVDDIAKYGAMIFPGGAGGTEAGSLSLTTHANLRQAVQSRGVGYVGFCAGSFIAVAPAGDDSYGIGVLAGPFLDYYTLENQGTDIAMTLLTYADGKTQDTLWYGGPVTPRIAGGVIATYPDGTPAITETFSGAGYVVLSGVHPTADQATLSALGVSSTDGTHQDTAWSLINAAIHQAPLPAK